MSLRIWSLVLIAPLACSAQSMEHRFAELRKSPPELYAFLLRMPKGGDLHNHLSGAVYAEQALEHAAAESLCIDTQSLSIANPVGPGHCASEPEASGVQSDNTLRDRLIDSLSMRAFVPGAQSGHDHFFATFAKLGAATSNHAGREVAELAERAAEQNESYLEIMAISGSRAVANIATQLALEDFETTRRKLLDAGLEQRVATLHKLVDEIEHERIADLHCDSQPDSAPCRITVRYQYYVRRESPKEQVFAQTLAGFMLCAIDPRVVAVNFVQAEDGYASMRDYSLHMRMVDFVKHLYPRVHISLHAGELTSGLVPPEGLRFHIREAIEIGHAERIGHGVDIMYETDALKTLRMMRDRHIDVEINLTSNAQILGVGGIDHPFPVYRKYGVPTTISTDDEGIERTHLTEEYKKAVLTYHLTYADVKQLARNSIEYSFLAGEDKTRVKADLEKRFRTFEAEELGTR